MRYFLGFLAAVGLIVLVFVLIFRSFGGNHTQPIKPVTILPDYSNTSTVVRLTIDGPINSNQEHNVVRVTVGRDGNTIEVMKGYQGSVVKSQSYDSNVEAYETFLRALYIQGYTLGDPDKSKADERGYCPTANRFVYEIVGSGGTIQRYWSATCNKGTFKGKGPAVRELFRRQIPDYHKLTQGLSV